MTLQLTDEELALTRQAVQEMRERAGTAAAQAWIRGEDVTEAQEIALCVDLDALLARLAGEDGDG